MFEAGNDAIDVLIRRHKHGLKLRIQAQDEVEAFFQQWSGGLQERPAHGRLWRSSEGPDTALSLWACGAQEMNPSASKPYSLLHSGAGFYVGERSYPNISFLRLCGISKNDGVGIIIEAVIGNSEVGPLVQRISEACQLFYDEYLRQINMRAIVSVVMLPPGPQPTI